ncbi:MAG: TolC family protein [Phycisphaerae bacterium]|nr:TolC family protein [Phycisphaerae bacterium]
MSNHPCWGWRSARVALGIPCLLLAACQSAGLSRPVEKDIAAAVDLHDAVTFRTDGAPIDETVSGATLTIEDAVRAAVASDAGLQAALARVRVAMADADQARLLPNPVLNLVLRWGSGSPQIEVSVAQDLIAVLKIPNRTSAADNRLRESAADAVTVALDVVADVQQAYAESQAGDALVPIFEHQAELTSRLIEIANARLADGEGTRGDVTTLDSQRIGLEVALADARLRSREARLRLARLIGQPSASATWALDPWVSPRFDLGSEDRWIDAALANRPELRAIGWELAALGDDEALAAFFPWDGASVGVDAQKDGDWTTGPAVSTPIPVFDMGQAAVARVVAERIEMRHRLTGVQREVVESVRTALVAVRAHADNLARVRDRLIPIEEERRRQAEAAYRAGQTDVTPLFLAEQGVSLAKARAIEIERETTGARIRLERAVGGPAAAIPFATANDRTNPAPGASSSTAVATRGPDHTNTPTDLQP